MKQAETRTKREHATLELLVRGKDAAPPRFTAIGSLYSDLNQVVVRGKRSMAGSHGTTQEPAKGLGNRGTGDLLRASWLYKMGVVGGGGERNGRAGGEKK